MYRVEDLPITRNVALRTVMARALISPQCRLAEGHSGALAWALLEKYNTVIRQIAAENDIRLINLGEKMPKSSGFFTFFIILTTPTSKSPSQEKE